MNVTESKLYVPAPSLLHQFAQPKGEKAELVARFMNVGNQRLNGLVIDALDLSEDHHVLDVGFGGGIGLMHLVDRFPAIRVSGVDPSEEMVERARGRFADRLATGQFDLRLGVAEALPFEDGQFDRAMLVNTVHFWKDVPKGLAELRRVLRPDGRAVFGKRCAWALRAARLAEEGYAIVEEATLLRHLEEAGFSRIEIREGRDPSKGGAVIVVAFV